MKRLMAVLFCCGIIFITQAQDADDLQAQYNASHEKIKAARVGFITQRLSLSTEQAEKFWPIYNELMQKRLELRNQYKEAKKNSNPDNPDPKHHQELVDLGLKIKQDQINLDKTYFEKLKSVITPQQMVNLQEAERDFRTTIIQMLNKRRTLQQKENKK